MALTLNHFKFDLNCVVETRKQILVGHIDLLICRELYVYVYTEDGEDY